MLCLILHTTIEYAPKNGRSCTQINQLSTNSHIEFEDYSVTFIRMPLLYVSYPKGLLVYVGSWWARELSQNELLAHPITLNRHLKQKFPLIVNNS